jgi:hypothetical protein
MKQRRKKPHEKGLAIRSALGDLLRAVAIGPGVAEEGVVGGGHVGV